MVSKKKRRHDGYVTPNVNFRSLKVTKAQYLDFINSGRLIESDEYYDDWEDYRDGQRDWPFREKRLKEKSKWKTKYTFLLKRKKLKRR